MKKEIIVFIFFLNGFTYSAFAANKFDATPQAKESFKKEYPEALYSKWETLQDGSVYSVRFVYNKQSLVAYYNEYGKAVGLAKIITIDKLPVRVKKAIADHYPVSEILNIQELIMDGRSSFYFDIKSNYTRFFIHVSDEGKIKLVHRK